MCEVELLSPTNTNTVSIRPIYGLQPMRRVGGTSLHIIGYDHPFIATKCTECHRDLCPRCRGKLRAISDDQRSVAMTCGSGHASELIDGVLCQNSVGSSYVISVMPCRACEKSTHACLAIVIVEESPQARPCSDCARMNDPATQSQVVSLEVVAKDTCNEEGPPRFTATSFWCRFDAMV